MKVLHISNSDNAGAGLCCLRIHTSMLKNGVDSKMVVLIKTRKDIPELYQYGSLSDKLYRYTSKMLRLFGLSITERNILFKLGSKHNTAYTTPLSHVDLTKCKLMDWADIIHLHWVNWYVDYPTFFAKVNKPIVWTLHDENLFYGMAHHHNSILPDNKIEIKYRDIKKKAIKNAKNLNIVFLSQMMKNLFGNNPLVKDRRQTVINNSVDSSMFFPLDKASMREKYNLEKDRIIAAFVANDICDPNKGLDVLSKIVSSISEYNIEILAIGRNTQGRVWNNVKEIGSVNEVRLLCEYLSAADFFVLPSYQEAFSQSPLEAMACGLPVVAFPVSGTKELINETNGVICGDFTKEELKKGILTLLNRKYNGNEIRKDVIRRFSPEAITKSYVDYYKQVLNV